MDEEHRRMGFGEDNRFYFRIFELEPLRLAIKVSILGEEPRNRCISLMCQWQMKHLSVEVNRRMYLNVFFGK